jgi:hypothetical protein
MKSLLLVLLALAPYGSVFGQDGSPAIQTKEREPDHPLRAYFERQGATRLLMSFRTSLIQKELDLTDLQKEKIASLRKDMRERLPIDFAKNPDFSPGDQAKQIESVNGEVAKKLEAILEQRQVNRLLEILSQWLGPMLLSEADVAPAFELTEDQTKEIGSIAKRVTKLMFKMGTKASGMTSRAELQKYNKTTARKQLFFLNEANEKIGALLTPKQTEQFNGMKDKAIDVAELSDETAEAAGIRPQALTVHDAMIELLTDEDGINSRGIRIADFGVEDPPVVFLDENPDQIVFPIFSGFVAAMIINDVLFFEEAGAEPIALDRDAARAALTCLVPSRVGDFFANAPLESATVVMFAYPGNGPALGKSRTPAGRNLLQRLRSEGNT